MSTISRAIRWLESMLVTPDGSQGIYERYRINLNRINPWVRPDCCLESARTFYAAGQLERGVQLAAYACSLQDRGDGFANGSFPFYVFRPWMPGERDIGEGFGIPDLPNFRWHNDQGKIAEYLLWFSRQTADPSFEQAAVALLEYLLRAQDEDGAFTRTPRGHNPHFRAADFVAWGAVALSRAAPLDHDGRFACGAHQALRWLHKHMHPSGRMLTGWETAQFEPWRPPASETAVALHAFAQGYWQFQTPWMLEALHRLAQTLVAWQHSSGGIRNTDNASRAAALQNDPDMADFVYVNSYALIALQEAYAVTGEAIYQTSAKRLAAFLVEVQCRHEAPAWDGAWRGSYHLERQIWYGSADPSNDLEEGGMNAVYTGWCAAPIAFGLHCLSQGGAGLF
ncbi:MAG: hypothetical protein SNJ59_11015 [Aggregatilineales bacterium]